MKGDSMTTKTDKRYEKYGWVLLFAVFLILFLRGLGSIFNGGASFSSGLQNLTGQTWSQIMSQNPGLATFINGTQAESGIFLVGFSLFGMAISRLSYRKGERWAWYVMWYLPIFILGLMGLVLTDSEGGGYFPANAGLLTLDLILLAIALIGLLLPFREFFPKKTTARAS